MTTALTHVAEEIRSQPAAWTRALDLLPSLTDALPRPGERVAVVGCGTSWFMAEAYAQLREEAGQGETDFFPASQVPADRRYERVVAITRSGTTTEVLQSIGSASCPVTAITADRQTPVMAAADAAIVLDFADEKSVVQTVFATTALMLLRASLGEPVQHVIDQTATLLDTGPQHDDADQYTFLGQGWAHGVAREAALKMREAAQAWTESYPQMEYRHGPIAIAQPGRVVWVFGAPVAGLLDDVLATGATVVCDDLDPVADLVRVQLLAVSRARRLGLDPDRPRHLTRSVVLSS
ncbi:MAG: SIS domain-containing protein [Jatrophihabitans sp.]